jgi:hypothetical protein
MAVTHYAGLGPLQTPFEIEHIMRGIGRIWSGTKVLRTTGALGGDASFEDGVRIAGGAIEIYKTEFVKPWAMDMVLASAQEANPSDVEVFQRRAAACVHSVLGIDGETHVDALVIWLPVPENGPEVWARYMAEKFDIPVHNLADPGTENTWRDWVAENTPVDYHPAPVE